MGRSGITNRAIALSCGPYTLPGPHGPQYSTRQPLWQAFPARGFQLKATTQLSFVCSARTVMKAHLLAQQPAIPPCRTGGAVQPPARLSDWSQSDVRGNDCSSHWARAAKLSLAGLAASSALTLPLPAAASIPIASSSSLEAQQRALALQQLGGEWCARVGLMNMLLREFRAAFAALSLGPSRQALPAPRPPHPPPRSALRRAVACPAA
jgi:hypothetical protein